MSDADARYQAKLRARIEGTTEVNTYPATPAASATLAEVDARYQAKLARHGKETPAVARVTASQETAEPEKTTRSRR